MANIDTDKVMKVAGVRQLISKIKSTFYTKPSTGIPKTDLDSSVQNSLGKADSALQTHQSLDGYVNGITVDSTTTFSDATTIVVTKRGKAVLTRTTVALWNYIKGKANSVYATLNHKHSASEITSGQFADSMIASASTWNAKQYPIQSNSIQNVTANVQGYFFIDCTDRHQTYIIKLEQNSVNSATFLYRSYWNGTGVFAKLTCLQSQNRDIVAYNEVYTPEGGTANSYHRVYFKLPTSASDAIWYITATKVGNSSVDYMPTPEYTIELPGSATLIPCEYFQTEDNKVTSWQTTTDNTHYPSEKLVKDALDGKQATLSWDTTPTANSTKPVTSGGIRTYVDSKAYVSATTLTSANNLNSYCGSASTPVMWYKWSPSSVPTNAPSTTSTSLMEVRFFVNSSGNYCMQTVYIAVGEIYVRMCKAGTWDSWTRHYLDATSTYSSTGKQAVNGTAVASAINALDSTKTSTNGTNVQVSVAETDGKISSVSITTDNTENRNNKITAWNATASTTAYPAESLVVSALANKKNVQTAKTDPTASGTGISYIATITQNANGEITATKSTVRTGTTSQTGVVQLSDTSSSTDSSKAATPKGVWNAINTLDKSDSAVSNQFVTAVSETNGIISVSRAQPTISNVSGLQTALNSKEGSFTITYNSEEHALVFSKAFT